MSKFGPQSYIYKIARQLLFALNQNKNRVTPRPKKELKRQWLTFIEIRTTTEAEIYDSFTPSPEPTVTSEPSITAALVQGQPEPISDANKMLKTCEQLMQAGFLESKVYNVENPEQEIQDDKDLKIRFCDQDTSGGGWTVPDLRMIMGVLVLLACLPI